MTLDETASPLRLQQRKKSELTAKRKTDSQGIRDGHREKLHAEGEPPCFQIP